MFYVLCPYCHARIDIEEGTPTGTDSPSRAFCGVCDESFFFDCHEVVREPEPEAIA